MYSVCTMLSPTHIHTRGAHPHLHICTTHADAVVNLERLMCGHLFLSTAITMFSDPRNTPSQADLIAATIEVGGHSVCLFPLDGIHYTM